MGNLHHHAATGIMNSAGHLLVPRDVIVVLYAVHPWKRFPAFKNICIAGYDQADVIFCQGFDQIDARLSDKPISI